MASSTAFLGLPNNTDKKEHVALETAHTDSSDTVEHPDLFKCVRPNNLYITHTQYCFAFHPSSALIKVFVLITKRIEASSSSY